MELVLRGFNFEILNSLSYFRFAASLIVDDQGSDTQWGLAFFGKNSEHFNHYFRFVYLFHILN